MNQQKKFKKMQTADFAKNNGFFLNHLGKINWLKEKGHTSIIKIGIGPIVTECKIRSRTMGCK